MCFNMCSHLIKHSDSYFTIYSTCGTFDLPDRGDTKY